MSFDPKRHVIRVQGNREYLPVSARLVWFRQEHPDWGIVTNPVEINMEKRYAIFSATIFNAEGKIMATATKMENVQGFADFLEKAETGAVGRALSYCGFGTIYDPDLIEGNRFADAPVGPGSYGGGPNNRFASGGQRPGGNGGNSGGSYGNNNAAGNGGARPMPGNGNGGPPPAQQPQRPPAGPPAATARPSAPPAPRPETRDDDPFGEEDAPPPARPMAAARPALVAESAPPPAPRPAPAPPAGNGVTRVREPERDDFDPGGAEELDDDGDPFGDEDDLSMPAPAPAPRAARPTEAPAAEAVAPVCSREGTSPIAGNRCSVDGCTNVLTAGQLTMSNNKFGRPLCILHQRDAAPAGAPAPAAAAPAAAGGARRPAPKATATTESLL